MQFKQITATKYIGEDGYYLARCKNGRFSILKGSTMTEWGKDFQTVRAAENFISQHDYKHASADKLPIAASDLKFIEEFYGAKQVAHNIWQITANCNIGYDHKKEIVTVQNKGALSEFDTMDSLLIHLDSIVSCERALKNVIYRGLEYREIFARSNRRSTRDITKNLIRVKSSNVWSYGVEMKDQKPPIGDVYVQFKAKNGGPGDIYKYYDVGIDVWRRVLSSPSKGHAIWKYLRNNYYYSKLTGNKRGVLPNAIN